ncbi:hypothetical protein CH275_16470 [Rhodococcus sp. 06-235-1A]|uniref:NAD-dependent epimerase/dehydratase family protein n=1 Tax=Rhodococcus sp. 06-235-1A TaxID=2022508 RepID=UPI000B9C3E0A|nr:NAD-dependent epimerase/dehydratase family protein [Rhodococcus sp. 06-235-1A]OZD03372.1 hypothetical protein CH275_16470 [Rhodococcus sp. 06-235-1A]
MTGKSYLITGGAGFIGSHFVERLLADPNTKRVVAFDNLSNSDTKWLEPAFADSRFSFIEGDVLDTDLLASTVNDWGVDDVVVHLASSVDMRKGLDDPKWDLRQCADGTLSVLMAMRTSESRKIIFSSSSTVYGEPALVPTPENVGPAAPISLYGAGKLAAEGILSAFCHLYGFTAHAFRFGNVVGGRMNHGVLYDFIEKLNKDSSRLLVLGDGKQRKNYFLVEECVAGILACSDRLGAGFQVLNLGNEGTIGVDRIAQMVIERMGLADVHVDHSGGERGWPGDVPIVQYDLRRAQDLGWAAPTDCESSVRIAISRLLGER